jgi:BON domain
VPAVRAVADEIEVRDPALHERADDEIAEQVAHLRRAGGANRDSVGVRVHDGTVILHGQVESAADREAIESAAHQLTGVRAVTNLIKVKPQIEPAAGAAATEQPARSLGDTLAVALGGAPDGQSAAVSARSGIAPVANSSADTDSALRELEYAAKFCLERRGITRDVLISRMGGSP